MPWSLRALILVAAIAFSAIMVAIHQGALAFMNAMSDQFVFGFLAGGAFCAAIAAISIWHSGRFPPDQ